MTYDEIVNIAKRLDKATRSKIDNDVEERLAILREGNLNEEEMAKMEECLYMSLVIQEYLDGEYELLEEEKAMLLDEMEELYNEYGELLTRAKLEEKLSKKKRMTLELMRIREQLFGRKDLLKDVNKNMKDNKASNDKLKELSSKQMMKEVAKDSKKDLPNPDKQNKWGLDMDTKVNPGNKRSEPKVEEKKTVVIRKEEINQESNTTLGKENMVDRLLKETDEVTSGLGPVPTGQEGTPANENADLLGSILIEMEQEKTNSR